MPEIDSKEVAAALERELVRKRREAAEVDAAQATQGLALSGGGIRSATFSFGLLRGLAQASSLKQFDYLSTVSGGGYIGSALGRLYQADQKADAVQERLGKNDTVLLWWLRNNGRYLTPAGARDMVQALASIVRNVFSSHFEVAVLMLLAASLLLLPYVAMGLYGVWQSPAGNGWPSGFWAQKGSVWWMFMTLPLFLALHFIFRYWYCRAWLSHRVRLANFGGAILAAYCGARLALSAYDSSLGAAGTLSLDAIFKFAGAAILVAPLGAAVFSIRPPLPEKLAVLRLGYTKSLGATLWVLLAFAVVGFLDYASWWLINTFKSDWQMPAISAATLAVLLTTLRTTLPAVQKWLSKGKIKRFTAEGVLNVAGILLVFLLALSWLSALHLLVRPESMVAPALGVSQGLGAYHSAIVWALALSATLAFCLLTAKDIEVLNLSSLHNFYRARIERAYVSVGNYAPVTTNPDPDRSRRFSTGTPLQTGSRRSNESVARLVEAVEGDDVALSDYRPHEHGGPIHLMSCCINQSVDDRTGNYNADRLGISLTMSALGAEIGTGLPTPLDQLPPVGSLSRWVAISGAAASSGMGSRTSPGLAALLFLSGLRLGYWSPKLLPEGRRNLQRSAPTPTLKRLLRWMRRSFPKPSLVMAELVAHFPGLRSTAWYVSDGGHFENTAVYALLKRRLDVIIVADCGADPAYRFDDVENLARKAEIDYGASIEFVDPAGLKALTAAQEAALKCVGTRETIAASAGAQFVLLGRIHYRNSAKPGVLIVIKPRLLTCLSMEVAGYALRQELFPQQPTGDQFFDEEQWEAYHQLGLHMGQQLTPQAITALTTLLTDSCRPEVSAPSGAPSVEPLITPSVAPTDSAPPARRHDGQAQSGHAQDAALTS